MNKKAAEFLERMLYFFPFKTYEYMESVKEYGEILETVIIEDIFMPEILKLLYENKDFILLDGIFEYFEEVANCNDPYLLDIFSATVLEALGNDPVLLQIAKKYMGPTTMLLQRNADKGIGRTVR